MKPLTLHTVKLTDDQAAALHAALVARNWKPRTVPHARFAFESDRCSVVFYESGKLVAQGRGTGEFVEFVLEPEVLKEARAGYETVLNAELLLPRLGVDESGKGDFFGPLCVSGVYVNEAVIAAWGDLGVRDSKNISSDKKIEGLADAKAAVPEFLRLIRDEGFVVYAFASLPDTPTGQLYARLAGPMIRGLGDAHFLRAEERPFHDCGHSRLVTFANGLATVAVLRKCCTSRSRQYLSGSSTWKSNMPTSCSTARDRHSS